MRRPRTDALSGLLAETDAVVLQRIDEAAGLGRPGGLGTTYAEHEYDTLADEQAISWPAEGEAASRAAQIRAASSGDAAKAASFLVDQDKAGVTAARDDYLHAAHTLTPYVRRSPRDHIRYGAGWVLLGLGDTAGVWGAAIWLGEVPLIALGQAVATGFAAVTAGLAGGELQELRQAQRREREPESLSADERRYQRLFVGADKGLGITKIASGISFAVVALVAVAVFALRAGTEGLLAGFTFGGLAAATALGSFISSYVHGDEVADLIATYLRAYLDAQRLLQRLADASGLSGYAGATTEADSISREYDARGQAAHRKVTALKYRMLRRNPQVVGHGEATVDAVIGRRSRLDGAA